MAHFSALLIVERPSQISSHPQNAGDLNIAVIKMACSYPARPIAIDLFCKPSGMREVRESTRCVPDIREIRVSKLFPNNSYCRHNSSSASGEAITLLYSDMSRSACWTALSFPKVKARRSTSSALWCMATEVQTSVPSSANALSR